MNTLREAVQDYLVVRRDLGFKLREAGKGLLCFVSFMEQQAPPISPMRWPSTGLNKAAPASLRRGRGA